MNELKTQSSANENAEEKQFDIGFYIKALWRSKWKIVSFTFGVTVIAALLILRLPSIYEAKATLYIKKENATPVASNSAPSMDMGAREYLKTQFGILQSDSLALEVINELQLAKVTSEDKQLSTASDDSVVSILKQSLKDFVGAPKQLSTSEISAADIKLQQTLEWYKRNISIKPVAFTQLVNISFQSEDPQLAADVINTLGNAYINSFLSAKMEQTDKAIEWLQSRNVSVADELAMAENELQQFIRREQIVGSSNGMQSLNAETLRNLNERRLEVREQRIRLENILSQTKSSEILDTGVLSQFTESTVLQELGRAEREAENQFNEVNQRYGPKHPKYIAANTQLQQVRSRLSTRVQSELSDLTQKLANLKQTEASLQRELASAESEVLNDSGKEAELNRLKLNVARLSELNELISRRFKELDITSDFSSENARFIDQAKRPLYPVKPAKAKLLIVVIVLSSGFACFVVVLLTFLNNTYRRSVEIEEELKAKFLGLIPKVSTKKNQVLPLHIYFDKEYRLFSEAVKTIRTGHMLGQLNNNNVVTLVTSAVPSEGKSTTSCNLSFSFGQMDKVLLIDADLRKPSIAKRFGLPAYQQGLSDILNTGVDVESCIVSDSQSGIDILPAGHYTHNALELFAGDAFATLLEKLKHKYTKIVIDSAPCQAVSDTLVLAKLADTVIFVVKADSTKKQVVKSAVRRLREAGGIIEGVVLNAADVSKQDGEYSGYYDYYGYADTEKA
ncbi:polysaccharide biosynthesis tyrosine autokinase [Alteromonas stellipolaris]|uniref:GumC family protein n=1 Tax=Alteromonas stellipolaris TaxID=233316 RepID=UPI0021191138|nr:polysaccharide biosynthesis tyrosine autokinase [Alteromonas stellipolaris]MCQ8847338.1 polysaccharide biosynthesis tyrosine autokinase [Alteromonas stellipolaris]